METLLGFQISGWDYLTFVVIFIIGVAFLALAIFILGLPGRMAIARNHPEADAVKRGYRTAPTFPYVQFSPLHAGAKLTQR